MQGTIRAYNDDMRALVKKRIEEISLNIGQAYRTTVTISYGGGCPTLKNDNTLSETVTNSLREVFDQKEVLNTSDFKGADIRGGSDDFSHISHELPSVMVALAAGEPEKGHRYALHHAKVTFDESVLWRGSVALAHCSMNFLGEV
jgi:hippurate hydrolase